MVKNQLQVSPKRTLFLILTIVFWVVFVGLEIIAKGLSSEADAPHKATDVNGVYALIGGVSFIFAAFSLVLAIIFTVALVKASRKAKQN